MKSLIPLLLILFSFLSCKSVRKEWVTENYAKKEDIQNLKESVSNEIDKQTLSITKNFNSKYNEVIRQVNSISKESKSEESTVTGEITAEDGKKKSVTFGDTTIESNGVNVSFTSTIRNVISKEYQGKFEEMTKQLQEGQQTIQDLRTEINSLKSEVNKLSSNEEIEKDTKTKTVKNHRLYSVILLILSSALVLFGVLSYFKIRIPFINRN